MVWTKILKKQKKFYKLAIKTKPSIDNLVAYYIFQEKFYPPADQSLLEKALEFPWENKEKLLRIAKLISDIDLRKGLEIYKQVYAKWNDEKNTHFLAYCPRKTWKYR